MTFVDLYEAFDSIEHCIIRNGLKNSRIDHTYMNIIRNVYEKATSEIKFHQKTNKIDINNNFVVEKKKLRFLLGLLG